MKSRRVLDSDTVAIRRASRVVGTRIAIACTAVVLVVIAAVFLYILAHITPAELFEPVPDEDNLRVGAIELLRGAAVLGVALIALAGVMSWLVTRRAMQPLGEALRIQRAFVADASHELRTPLAVLDARLQMLQRTLRDDDPSADMVEDLRRDTTSLIRIVNDLLESAEAGGLAAAEPQSADVVAAVDEAVRAMSVISAEKDVAIEFRASPAAKSYVPPSGITRCAVALIDNAVRFAPAGSTVAVEVTPTSKTVSVIVRDRGAGLQGMQPSRIFDRFAHAEATTDGEGARSGFGIGLSLVRDIALRYGGSVEVTESPDEGTAVSFSVPRARDR